MRGASSARWRRSRQDEIGTRAATRMPIETYSPIRLTTDDRGFEMYGSSRMAAAPRGRDRFVTLRRPTVLYRGRSATVTTKVFTADGFRYPVAELNDLSRVEHGGLLQSKLYELWALFRGQRIRVFLSFDKQEFGQVCRALTRAREYAGLT